jgi:hypothetical protein
MARIIFPEPYFFFEVLPAIQNRIVNTDTKYGKIPKSVPDAEWEFLSTAMKTVKQKVIARSVMTTPTIDSGM